MKYQFCKLIGISGLKEGSMFWDYFFCSILRKNWRWCQELTCNNNVGSKKVSLDLFL